MHMRTLGRRGSARFHTTANETSRTHRSSLFGFSFLCSYRYILQPVTYSGQKQHPPGQSFAGSRFSQPALGTFWFFEFHETMLSFLTGFTLGPEKYRAFSSWRSESFAPTRVWLRHPLVLR